MKRRVLLACVASIGVALALVVSCSSSDDYEGGGRRTSPPGAVDGAINLLPADANGAQDTGRPDTNAPGTPDSSLFRPDSGPG